MRSGGGNHAVGNGGVDTALYDGNYVNYQIKSDGAKIFVITNKSFSTLDTLEGITFIRFLDGTYNTTTGKFSEAPNIGNR